MRQELPIALRECILEEIYMCMRFEISAHCCGELQEPVRELAMDFRRIVTALLVALYCVMMTPLSGEAAGLQHNRSKVPAYFVFGDSFADVGTNNFVPNATALANFPPYGETYFHKPTGRFTNGRNIVDFFGKPPTSNITGDTHLTHNHRI